MRRVIDYSSSCTLFVLVCFQPFCCYSLFCSRKSQKILFWKFKVIQSHRCWYHLKTRHQCLLC